LSRWRRIKCLIGTYIKFISSYISQYISQFFSAKNTCDWFLIVIIATTSPVSANVFLNRLTGIPHFRMINHDDFARWRWGYRHSECVVQCTECGVLLDHECFTTITPGRCWVCCCVWNWRKRSACSIRCFADAAVADVVEGEEEEADVVADFVDVEFAVACCCCCCCCLLVSANGTSCAGSSLNKWSPSRWRIASTIVSRFCRDVFAMYNLACDVPSSRELDGEGNLQGQENFYYKIDSH